MPGLLCLAGGVMMVSFHLQHVYLLYRDILVLGKCGIPWTRIQRAADKRGHAF